ncbi:hypothetical protein C8Q80DRAFT_636659 [Daedaleopsis nitida]|nr:hypothetical protein C8Q80DRAFT_636659 [Daedaleopsis nitida]
MIVAAQDMPLKEDHPPSVVPGVWAAVVGRSAPGVDTNEFFVDDATADAVECWAHRQDSFSVKDRHVAVHLLCLPQASVASAFQSLPQDATPGDIAAALWNVKPSWPLQGRLVVQVNSILQGSDNSTSGRVWLPADLSGVGHIDITPWIVRGKNTINLIELEALSDYFFVVHATEPSAKEKEVIHADVLAWSHVSRFTSRSPARSPRNSQTPMTVSAPSPLMA